ncbi:tRNA pseudouridine(55) synthase TruB [Streptomyces hainanensis]|uniref:tRNA pseudouridine synthase B n=1 Tax=Streptomyces hainanensis TaxID=402648 RepID=A0A4R4SJC1_9ACTN|nr:tRNA pseudouridine(55) synthase TruB [Streptomyces hainanensis]TDC63700.1 tRNA pseudouridine(55) synthase TruB [Streptomyces hainanensis]
MTGSTADGLVVVDKPAGFTSHDVVAVLRGIARTRRVGHAGTLDPMATGVLLVGLGRATRLLGHLALTDKEYRGTIRLGQTTVTDDAEGEVTAARGAAGVEPAAIAAGVAALTGEIMQVPAKVSAVKIDGQRSYRRVRAGEEVEIPARRVTVSTFTADRAVERVLADGLTVTDVDITVVCSSGTYIRALARDLGAALGTGGHLTALHRTRVGPYTLGAARTVDELRAELVVLPLDEAAAASFPRWDVTEREARLLGNGARIATPRLPAGPVAVFGPDDRLVALVEADGDRARSLAVFAPQGG